MKKLTDFTDAEKLKIFDEIHQTCVEELQESKDDPDEHDTEYFWEGVIETFLGPINENGIDEWNE